MRVWFQVFPVFTCRIPTRTYGQKWEQGRWQPHNYQHNKDTPMRHYQRIIQGLYNGIISESKIQISNKNSKKFEVDASNLPVHWYTTQMHYTGRGEVNIETIPHITHYWAKHPFAGYFNGSIKGHGTQCHQHIRHSQGDHKIICNNPVLSPECSRKTWKKAKEIQKNKKYWIAFESQVFGVLGLHKMEMGDGCGKCNLLLAQMLLDYFLKFVTAEV